MTFKSWLKEQTQNDLWSASKEDIIKFWKSLNPEAPIDINPIKKTHKGSTYGEDGIRITGSPNFIKSVLSKIKSLLSYENTQNKLTLSYRETQSPSQLEKGNLKKSYVFYIQVKERN